VGTAIPAQHRAVVLRSHYKQLRALLATAMIAVGGLTAAVVILATNDDRDISASSATQVSARGPTGSTRYDGGPTRAAAASSAPRTQASVTVASTSSPAARPRRHLTPIRSRARLACATTAARKKAPAARCPPTRSRTPCRAPATTAAPRKAAGAAATSSSRQQTVTNGPPIGGPFAVQLPGRSPLPLRRTDPRCRAQASVWGSDRQTLGSDDLRERSSILRRHLLGPGGAGARGSLSGALGCSSNAVARCALGSRPAGLRRGRRRSRPVVRIGGLRGQRRIRTASTA
jgi:hypothetical protein